MPPPGALENRSRTHHDRTSYGITPTLPSPTQSGSLPSLQSASNSSGSPPLPSTPPPRHSRSRYNDVGLGRVPLHRRGTSTKLEHFEDLLREAGYKETRIFTPEQGPAKVEDEQEDRRLSLAGSVVGFLSGLVPKPLGRASSLKESTTAAAAVKDRKRDLMKPPELRLVADDLPPESPVLPRRRSQRRSAAAARPSSSSGPRRSSPVHLGPRTAYDGHRLSSPVDGLGLSPKSRYRHSPLHGHHQADHDPYRQHTGPSPSFSRNGHSPQLPMTSMMAPQPFYPRTSRAQAYLRHMASAPDIPKRPNSTPPVILNDIDDNGDRPPPLPRTWLETVARAVMYGGVGYVGGPKENAVATTQESERGRPPLRASNTNTNSGGRPDFLSAVSAKSERSASVVSRTKVVCRSTPSSRAASPERKGKGKGKKKPNGPTLSKTKTEEDDYDLLERRRNVTAPSTSTGERFMIGWGHPEPPSPSTTSSDDSDEGELDLARMLVPAKRQKSVMSLRKHLSSSIPNNPPALNPNRKYYGSGNSRTFRRWNSSRNTADIDEEEEERREFLGFLQDGGRTGLPRDWTRNG